MSAPVQVITLSGNPLLLTYAACALVLSIKVLFMAILTGRQRARKGVFANPEDVAKNEKAKVKFDDVDVERVRRAHLNDLENIPFFLVVAFLYITIGQPSDLPSVALGKALLVAVTVARIVHSIVYAVLAIGQPARGVSWLTGYAITLYMAVATLIRIAYLTA